MDSNPSPMELKAVMSTSWNQEKMTIGIAEDGGWSLKMHVIIQRFVLYEGLLESPDYSITSFSRCLAKDRRQIRHREFKH